MLFTLCFIGFILLAYVQFSRWVDGITDEIGAVLHRHEDSSVK